MNRKYTESIDQQLAGLTAGYLGLRRFVLEAHSKVTGEPMNRSTHLLWRYIDAEFDKIVEEARKLSPEFARILEAAREPAPPA